VQVIFDQELHLILAEILNVNQDAHSTWVQATLSVGERGLAIPIGLPSSPVCLFASAVRCNDLNACSN